MDFLVPGAIGGAEYDSIRTHGASRTVAEFLNRMRFSFRGNQIIQPIGVIIPVKSQKEAFIVGISSPMEF